MRSRNTEIETMKIKFDLVWEWPKPISWLWSNWHHFFFPLHKPLSTTKSRKIPSMGEGEKSRISVAKPNVNQLSQWLLKGQIKKGGYEYVNTMFFMDILRLALTALESIAISAFYLDVNIMWKLGHFPQTIYSRFAELESPINILLQEIKTYWFRETFWSAFTLFLPLFQQ